MSVTINTQAMKTRETVNSQWSNVMIKTDAEVKAVVQDTEPTGNKNVWFDTSDESEVVVPTMDDLNTVEDNLKNSFVVLTGSLASTSDYTEFQAYPDGFNASNTVVISIQVQTDTNQWRIGEGVINTDIRLFVRLGTAISIYNNDPALYGKTYKLMLYRYF